MPANSALQNPQKNIMNTLPQVPELQQPRACSASLIYGLPRACYIVVTDASSEDRNGCRGSLAFAVRNHIGVAES